MSMWLELEERLRLLSRPVKEAKEVPLESRVEMVRFEMRNEYPQEVPSSVNTPSE